MQSRTLRLASLAAVLLAGVVVFVVHARLTFPDDRSPEGSYARIVLAVSNGNARESFAYLETQAQWAVFTTRDYRSKAASRIAAAYPEPERSMLLEKHRAIADSRDGPDAWSQLAEQHGFVTRLRRDLSGIHDIEIVGERATIQTARGTRYAFRRRENGIWGLTLFTGELLAEAQKAARDFEVVERAARDYENGRTESTSP